MKETLIFLIRNVLPEDTEFSVQQMENEMGITFNVIVPEEFRAKIIGKSGKNIQSIRDVIGMQARKINRKIYIKIID